MKTAEQFDPASGLSASKKRRPTRKDQRAHCSSYRHRIRMGQQMPPSYHRASSTGYVVKGESERLHISPVWRSLHSEVISCLNTCFRIETSLIRCKKTLLNGFASLSTRAMITTAEKILSGCKYYCGIARIQKLSRTCIVPSHVIR